MLAQEGHHGDPSVVHIGESSRNPLLQQFTESDISERINTNVSDSMKKIEKEVGSHTFEPKLHIRNLHPDIIMPEKFDSNNLLEDLDRFNCLH